MPTYTETNRLGDVLKREFDPLLNRETVTLLSGQNLGVGAVLAKNGAGKYLLQAPAASDGTEVVAGVLLFAADATAGDTKCVILARGPAVVADGALVFAGGITVNQRAAAIAGLASLGIVARASA